MMGTICRHTISLDGFIAGPDDAMDGLFGFGEATSLADETIHRVGAILAGRRWYELATERWNGVGGIYGGAYDGRVFVLTHHPPADGADARISFLSDPIDAAVAIAEEAAGDKDVGIFGATLTRQCLEAGLLDEIVLHVAPVLLGRGVRLFGGEAERIELERVGLGEAEQLTDPTIPGRQAASCIPVLLAAGASFGSSVREPRGNRRRARSIIAIAASLGPFRPRAALYRVGVS
jgi:dihydrofolate reductase